MLNPFGRKIKQANVLLSWLIFLLVIAGLIWFLVAKPQPTGKIKSLKIENVKATLKVKDKAWQSPFTYKVAADILNPNQNFDAKKVNYIFEIKDKNQKVLVKKEGTAEVPANEKKTIQEELTINTVSKNVSFQLTKAQWEQITTSE